MTVLLRASNWPLEWPLVAVVVTALLYLHGGRLSATASGAMKRWRGAAFYGGLLAIVLAVDSPVDAYADRLFWAHMVQHVLLMMVAPPLLLMGRPWSRRFALRCGGSAPRSRPSFSSARRSSSGTCRLSTT
jgi:cytochrome c oxidase assembly factor CtaG